MKRPSRTASSLPDVRAVDVMRAWSQVDRKLELELHNHSSASHWSELPYNNTNVILPLAKAMYVYIAAQPHTQGEQMMPSDGCTDSPALRRVPSLTLTLALAHSLQSETSCAVQLNDEPNVGKRCRSLKRTCRQASFQTAGASPGHPSTAAGARG